jgi:hypothetical protein
VNRYRPTLEGLEARAVPTTLTVNTTRDVLGHDDDMLSLRQAIIDANAAPKADIIIVPAGTYTLTRPGINEDMGLTGDLDRSGDLTIRGAGAGTTTVNAAGLDRVCYVLAGGNVNLSGLTINGGVDSAVDDSGLGILGSGGGIFNEGTLTVRDCTVSGTRTVVAELRSKVMMLTPNNHVERQRQPLRLTMVEVREISSPLPRLPFVWRPSHATGTLFLSIFVFVKTGSAAMSGVGAIALCLR